MIDWIVFLLQIGIILFLIFLIFEYQAHLRAHRKIKKEVKLVSESTRALNAAYQEVLVVLKEKIDEDESSMVSEEEDLKAL